MIEITGRYSDSGRPPTRDRRRSSTLLLATAIALGMSVVGCSTVEPEQQTEQTQIAQVSQALGTSLGAPIVTGTANTDGYGQFVVHGNNFGRILWDPPAVQFQVDSVIDIGDVDGDNVEEIVVGDTALGLVHVLTQTGLADYGAFDTLGFSPDFTTGCRLAAGKLDTDLRDEIVVACPDTIGGNVLIVPQWMRDFAGHLPDGVGFPPGSDIEVADLNNDGWGEIIIGNAATGQLEVYSHPDHPLAANYPIPLFAPEGRITSGDLNGDGFKEVIVATSEYGVHFYTHPGQPVPPNPIQWVGFANGLDIAAGDIDGDGLAEVLVPVDQLDVEIYSPAGTLPTWFIAPITMYDGDSLAVGERLCQPGDLDCNHASDDLACTPGEIVDCTVHIPTPGCGDEAGYAVCGSEQLPGPCYSLKDGTAETYNGLDDDCDGLTDECDPGDTFWTCTADAGTPGCGAVPGIVTCDHLGLTGTCNPIGSGVDEVLNGLDDDCNGVIDECWGESMTCTTSLGTPGCDSVPGIAQCDHATGWPLTCEPTGVGNGNPELANGIDDNCDGVGLGDEFCDGIDNDGDGLIDEDAGSCLQRFLFVPVCWTNTDQSTVNAAAQRSVRFMEDKSFLTECASPEIPSQPRGGTGQKIWVDVAPHDVIPCMPPTTSSSDFLKEVRAAGYELANYDVVSIITDTPSTSCIAGFTIGGGYIQYEAGNYPGEYAVFAHEYGHLIGLGEEYRVDAGAPNEVSAANGCDPATCCTTPIACAGITGNLCLGNLSLDAEGWYWGPSPTSGSLTLLDPGGMAGIPPAHGNSRCIMSNASALGWDQATDSFTGEGSERSWCKSCLQRWLGHGPMCLHEYDGAVRRLEVNGHLGINLKVSLAAHNISAGRVGPAPPEANGSTVVEISDTSGNVLTTFSPEVHGAEPSNELIDLGFWIRVPVEDTLTEEEPLTFRGIVDGMVVSQTTANGEPPVAVASGVDIECTGPDGAFVALDASASTDPDGDTLVFDWEAPVDLSLANADSATPSAQFPLGETELTLTVSDGSGLADVVTVIVNVVDETPPEFDEDTPVTLTATSCDLSGADVSVVFPEASDLCGDTTVTGLVSSSDSAGGVPFAVEDDGSVALPPGTHTITWTATDGANPIDHDQVITVWPGVFADRELDIRDGAKVIVSSGDGAAISNAGGVLTQVGGVNTLTGPILSQAQVKVWGGTVTGDIVSAGAIDTYNSSDVGEEFPNSSVVLPDFSGLPSATFPAAGEHWTIVSGDTKTLDPGSYGNVTLNSNATLVLSAGDYYFRNLSINDDSEVQTPAGTDRPRIFVLQGMAHRGPFVEPDGSLAEVYVEFHGQGQVVLEASFRGIFLATNATVELGRNGTTDYYGQFAARTLRVRPNTTLTCAISDELDTSLEPSDSSGDPDPPPPPPPSWPPWWWGW